MKNYNPHSEEKVVSFPPEKSNLNKIMNLHPLIPFNEADIIPN